jgi:hypothetical protein
MTKRIISPYHDPDDDDFLRPKRTRRLRQRRNERRREDYSLNENTSMILSFAEEHFAYQLATELNDLKSIVQYRKYVQKYPKDVLEDIKDQVLAAQNVRKKGAVFTTLLQQYDFNQKYYPRD